jgi:hypothetical protein
MTKIILDACRLPYKDMDRECCPVLMTPYRTSAQHPFHTGTFAHTRDTSRAHAPSSVGASAWNPCPFRDPSSLHVRTVPPALTSHSHGIGATLRSAPNSDSVVDEALPHDYRIHLNRGRRGVHLCTVMTTALVGACGCAMSRAWRDVGERRMHVGM